MILNGFSRLARFVLFLCYLLVLAGCDSAPEPTKFSGQTMGTRYNVTLVAPLTGRDISAVEAAIETALADVNARFSNWDSGSEVSRFNAQGSDEVVSISKPFGALLEIANQVHVASEGRFDVTLAPLIELWGFGATSAAKAVPDEDAIQGAMAQVGQGRLLSYDASASRLKKHRPDVTLNLSAIAKGAGVDEVAAALAALGHENYMVEIGGELLVRGAGPRGAAWRIGLERPDAAGRLVERVLEITDTAVATSGDYRNYFERDGVRYSHILDPTTGRPVVHDTASVTVLADTVTLADAWATALLVLGSQRGTPVAERHGIAALFIDRMKDAVETTYETTSTAAFDRKTAQLAATPPQ